MRRSAIVFAAVVMAAAAMILTACAKAPPPMNSDLRKTVQDYFPIAVGGKMVRMQVAVLEPEQERGLMDRRDLGRNDGMLFVYAKSQQMHFWMHNTPTPLDIGFFDSDGVLVEIYPMQPFDESTVSSRSDRIQFPLEMNQGWFRDNSIRPGARLDLKALAKALTERGFDPAKFGLSLERAR